MNFSSFLPTYRPKKNFDAKIQATTIQIGMWPYLILLAKFLEK